MSIIIIIINKLQLLSTLIILVLTLVKKIVNIAEHSSTCGHCT